MMQTRIFLLLLLLGALVLPARAQTLVTLTDTLFNGDGTKPSGSLILSWPAFTGADGTAVGAGTKTFTVTAGAISLTLAPNAGATPTGTSYTADFRLTDIGRSLETWVVPATGPVTLGAVRVLSVPAPTATYITSLNTLTTPIQTLVTGTTGSDFNIASAVSTHTFHLPSASATKRGALTSADWTTFNGKAATGTCTNQFITGLSSSAITCTSPTLASAQFANQGTTMTVLHGNAAGNPSFAGVSLTADATVNQGTTTTLLHGNAAGAPSWAGVSLANDTVANQGTTTTVLHGNGAGQPSFGAVTSADTTGTFPATAHDTLSATHGDTTAASVVRGDIIAGIGATPKWEHVAKGTQYQVLTGGANEPGWAALALDQITATSGILGSAKGGTTNGFTAFTGPTTAEKTFTLPDVNATLVTGTGTTNTIPKTTGAGTQGDSNITDDGTTVMVGTTTAGKNLTVTATEGVEQAPALVTPLWTLGVGWVYEVTPNRISKTGAGTTTTTWAAATTIVVGTTYKVVITVDSMSGSTATYTLGGAKGNALVAAGTYTDYLTAGTTATLIITPVATALRTQISVISVLPLTDATGNLTVGGNLKLKSPIQSAAGIDAIEIAPDGGIILGPTTSRKAQTGLIRLPWSATVVYRNSTDTADYTPLSMTVDSIQIGTMLRVYYSTQVTPGTAGTFNLGATDLPWKDFYLSGTSSTPATNQFKLTGVSTGGQRIIKMPDFSGMIMLGNGTGIAGSSKLTAVATPVNATFTQTDTGGVLEDVTTYYYRVAALDGYGTTLASTETSLATSATAPHTHTIVVNWAAVTGASGGYTVYGRTTGAEQLIATVGAGVLTYTDTGSIAPSGALPTVNTTGNFQAASFGTTTDCADGAGAASCGAAASGSFVIDATATQTVVSTTAITALGKVFLQNDSSLGTKLGVTCNTQSSLVLGTPRVTARTAGVSFTADIDAGPTTNPMCVNYWVVAP